MKFIGKDKILFENLKKSEFRILDAEVKRVNIFTQDFGLYIEIDFAHEQYKEYHLRLRFSSIKEYSFYHNDTHYFYTVECYKLIMDGEYFYLSLDPEDEFSIIPSDNDQDIVVCKNFEGYLIELNQANP